MHRAPVNAPIGHVAQSGESDPKRDRGGPAQPMLIVRGLKKHFEIGGSALGKNKTVVRAVDGVNFSVGKGETLGIVGESGCGKSTTARLLMHLITPDAGDLIFDGEEVGSVRGINVRDLRQNMQMVFQDSYASLNPRLTIRDSIAYGPRVTGIGKAEAVARAEKLLGMVGLEPGMFALRYPHELSGGQRQRVNIARALAMEPRMLILDESVSALDKSVEAQVLNLLRQLKRELNLTYVFISHDLNVVQYVSDRVLVMYLGQVVESGPVGAIYGGARHPYTTALLSSRPSMDPRRRVETPPLSGDPPNPINPPSGCRFRTRCPHAQARCAEEAPTLAPSPLDPNHLAACHFPRAAAARAA
ncbi:dipeptide/oligopeptide/nickel ABC transporter ATP-binding protein [Achromobacter aloeverae]|uniref:Glutathione import ATP-binding protein GsiA n=2 Tax=Achromobacter aloeverae TaxID=1750518 RepID=A0A4V1MRZ7_9BURK|nr:dipeptide/oligopeptide/nickel ABC transporter ATP-binding protein [Achromobacter aloeverae]